ncbi:MAG: hypothetical protein QM796_01180 [Chthoniobacteraceae bacterium]
MLLAGDEALLNRLPSGQWIGGTIPYFMTAEGGCKRNDLIFVTELPKCALGARIEVFQSHKLDHLYSAGASDEVSFIIIPAGCSTHQSFALNAPGFPEFASHPLIGWISGVDLDAPSQTKPKVYAGNATPLEDAAVVLRLKLPPTKFAQINIINLFHQGDGDTITFPVGGFAVNTAQINGVAQSFSTYLKEKNVDTRLPLVADYAGAMINVSIKKTANQNGEVEFYAPVVPGIEYRLASPVGDYVKNFVATLGHISPSQMAFSCNCILNYLYSGLEGKTTGGITGPITFGEIAYQLLNQTLAYLTIEELT